MATATTDLEIASLTDTGQVREKNEDTVRVAGPGDAGHDWQGWLVVADGAGGHAAGEQASQAAVAAAWELLTSKCAAKEAALRQHLQDAVQAAHQAVREVSERVGGMSGSTFTALGFRTDQLVLGHIGDSRAYRWRAGQLEQLSTDHTMVAAAVASGRMTAEEAGRSPFRHQLLQGLGMEAEIEPQTAVVDLQPGDVYLVCCDGLWEVVGDDTIRTQLARTEVPLSDIAEELVRTANERGGPDNISVALARRTGTAPPAPPRYGNWLIPLAVVLFALGLGTVLFVALSSRQQQAVTPAGDVGTPPHPAATTSPAPASGGNPPPLDPLKPQPKPPPAATDPAPGPETPPARHTPAEPRPRTRVNRGPLVRPPIVPGGPRRRPVDAVEDVGEGTVRTPERKGDFGPVKGDMPTKGDAAPPKGMSAGE